MYRIDSPPNAIPRPVGNLTFAGGGRFLAWSRPLFTPSDNSILVANLFDPGSTPRPWVVLSTSAAVTLLKAVDANDLLAVVRNGSLVVYYRDALEAQAQPPASVRCPTPSPNLTVAADGSFWWFQTGQLYSQRPGEAAARPEAAEVSEPIVCQVAPDGNTVAVLCIQSERPRLAIFDRDNREPFLDFDTIPDLTDPNAVRRFRGPNNVAGLLRMRWSADGRYLAILIPHRLYVVDRDEKILVGPLQNPHTQLFLAPEFDQTGRLLYAGGVNIEGGVYAWEIGSWKPVAAYAWPVGPVTSLAIAPDGATAAVGGQGGTIAVWDVDA